MGARTWHEDKGAMVASRRVTSGVTIVITGLGVRSAGGTRVHSAKLCGCKGCSKGMEARAG